MARVELHTGNSIETDELAHKTTFYRVGSADMLLWPVGEEPILHKEDMLQLRFKDERFVEAIHGENARKDRDSLEAVGFVLYYAQLV